MNLQQELWRAAQSTFDASCGDPEHIEYHWAKLFQLAAFRLGQLEGVKAPQPDIWTIGG